MCKPGIKGFWLTGKALETLSANIHFEIWFSLLPIDPFNGLIDDDKAALQRAAKDATQ